MKILVVDDEQDICEILQYNLETEGYEVVTANSAEEALELPLLEYGLILLDVMMDEMSGFQMARKMKDNPATAPIPIIFITALEGEDNMVKGLNIGADDYITKPLSMKEVKARVRAVLRRASVSNQHPEGKGAFPTSDHQISYEGITLDLSDIGDCNLLVMYAAYLYRKRAESTVNNNMTWVAGMPRMLRYAMNNRLFAQKMSETEEG